MKRTPLSRVNCGKRNCIALAPECSASQLGRWDFLRAYR
jgi:hypothetical protein